MNQSKEYKQMAKRLEYPHPMTSFQVNTIKAMRNGQDAFVIAAPGKGKSGIFHGAALLDESRLVLVVEPTISLIMDQEKRLRSLEKPVNVEYMTYHNPDKHSMILDRVIRGGVTLLFVTPERLQRKTFQQAIARNEPWLVVVDEAHLVLHWGRTFRKDYNGIGKFIDSLKHRPVVLALTATAPLEDRKEIQESLHMNAPYEQILSIDKPNLSIVVKNVSDKRSKHPMQHLVCMLKQIRNAIDQQKDDGRVIVYCLTPDYVDITFNYLAKIYGEDNLAKTHGKLSKEKRTENEDSFINGETWIMVASSAFGQGVDTGDVRLVIHLGLPLNVVDYYQQIGRAGRDDGKAKAVVIYDTGMMKVNKSLIKGESSNAQGWMTDQQSKLEEIITGDKCIMQQILHELGEQRDKPCGHCSVCQRDRRRDMK